MQSNREPLNPPSSPTPELRLVLLGRKGAGKSSAGNTILGLLGCFETGKPTEECAKRRGDISGRRVTVVDTPGWEWYYPVNGTPAWVRRETKRSISLCPPGPHAVLLVVRSCTSVTTDYLQQIEEHLELLGRGVWDHTLVVFTRGDELGSVPIEQRIESSGKAFQRLLERCGNRFHVVENKKRVDDGSQVKELIRKIDVIVEERRGRCFESDLMFLELELESKRRARERRKKQRMMEAQTHRGTIKAILMSESSQIEDPDEKTLFSRGSRRLPELRLVLLGERETGKSSAGNAILGGLGYFQSGEATEECSRQQAEASNRLVTVVDVPGWEGGPEGVTPERVKREMGLSVTVCPPGPHALLLTLRVDTVVQAQVVREHMELLGEAVWRHTILLFTRGDQLREGVSIEQHIHGGGKELLWLVERCSNRFHVISSSSSSDSQITELLEKIEKMVAGNRCEAFSPLVQEIQEMGRQKNEKFQVKVKEFAEKLQRQEEELRKMKEREVKSIRWFFERRKKDKVQSPGKVEREEVAYKGEDDRRSVMGELEERMAWLTEDKEREIQELSAEMSKLVVNYHQMLRDRNRLLMRLEEREREGEEKADDLQVKLLEIERLEQEQRERDGETQHAHLEEVKELLNKLIDAGKENEKIRGEIEEAQNETRALRRNLEDKVKHTESKLKEKDNQVENLLREIEVEKLNVDCKEKEHRERFEEVNEKKRKEMEKLREKIETMTSEMEQLQRSCREQMSAREAEREMHESMVENYNTLLEKLVCKDEEIDRTLREKENMLQQDDETRRRLKLKEDELERLRVREMEKDRELERVRTGFQEAQKERERHRAELQVLDEELNAKEKKIHDLQQKMWEKDDEVSNLMQNISQKQIEIESLQAEAKKNATGLLQELKERESEIKTYRKRDQEKEAEVNKLQQNITEKQNIYEKLKDSFEDYIKELSARLKHLEEELLTKEKEINTFKLGELEKEKNIATQQKADENFKESIRVKIEQSATRVKGLEEDLQTKDQEIELLRIKETEMNKELKMISESGKDVKERLEKSSKQILHLEDDLQVKEAEVSRLNQQALEINREMDRMVEKHRRDVENLQCSRQAKSEEDRVKIHELQETIEACKKRIAILEEEMRNLIKQKEESRLAMENFEQQLTESERSLEEVRRCFKEEELCKEKLQKELIALKVEQKVLLDEKERERQEIKMFYELQLQDRFEREKEQERDEEELYLKKQALMSKVEEIQSREQQLMEEKQLLEVELHKIREDEKNLENECCNIRLETERLERIKEEIQRRSDEMWLREEDLKMRELQVHRTNNELQAKEKRMEKQENNMENFQEEIEKKEKKLMELKESLAREQLWCKEREKTLEAVKASLEQRENELEKKNQELGQSSERQERDKQEMEKLQSDLQQKSNALKEKEEELIRRETALEQTSPPRFTDNHQDVKKQNALHPSESAVRTLELESIKEALGKMEQDVIKVEEAISQRGQKRSEEIPSDSRVQGKQIKNQQDALKNQHNSLNSRETYPNPKREVDHNKKQENCEMRRLALEEREKELEEGQRQLNNREVRFTTERDRLKKKREELEKWEKYLYNKELEMIQTETDTWNCDRRPCERENVERIDVAKNQVTEEPSDEENEDFFESSSTVTQPPQKIAGTELRLMLLGDCWSSRHPLRCTLVGPDANATNPWRGEVSGRWVTIVEPQGLKWRSGSDCRNNDLSQSLCKPKPHAFILVIPAFVSVSRQFLQAVEHTMSSLGEEAWSKAIVLITWAEALGESAQKHVMRNGDLGRLVRRCGNRCGVIDNRQRESHVEKLLEKVEEMLGLKETLHF